MERQHGQGRGASLGGLHPHLGARGPRGRPPVAHRGAPGGPPFDRERHHHLQGATVAPHGRPRDAGKQVGQDAARRRRAEHHQAVGEGLPSDAGERDPLRQAGASGECAGGAGRVAGAPAAAADVQAGGAADAQPGRLGGALPRGLPVLHHEQAPQPLLHPRDGRQGHAAQLCHHARRPDPAAPRRGGGRGAARPGAAKGPACGQQRGDEQADDGDRVQHPPPARGEHRRHPRGRDAHQHARRVQEDLVRGRDQAPGGRGDGEGDRRDQSQVHPRRLPRHHPLLRRRRPRRHRPHVPVLSGVVCQPLPPGDPERDPLGGL
mmetsp:Transcript_11759/g.29362  ORF Transcript_11759/g.29362 Transcript_11759/m.29362 type:complete len:320 (+) Transcript_11759:1962-2921(+)